MASSEFDVEYFEKRLHGLKDSQESIQGLSAWCLERRQHHKKIVATWLQVLKKGENFGQFREVAESWQRDNKRLQYLQKIKI